MDATNIERNLYLTTQLIETGVPVVIALNMADLLEKRGIKIDVARLSMLLDCPIVETSALKGEGLDKLIDEAIKTAKKKEADLPKEIFNKDLEDAVSAAAEVLPLESVTVAVKVIVPELFKNPVVRVEEVPEYPPPLML